MAEKKWQEFEALIANLQAQATPGAEVKHNQKIKGRSGRLRQLDITISQKVGLYPVLIVIECKQYRRPVSIEKVEAFVLKLRDVDASHGVIVSNSGFDDGAKAIARDNFVTLLSYREAEEFDWRSVVGKGAWLTLVVTEPENVTATFIDPNQVTLPSPSDRTLYDVNGNALLTLKELYGQLDEGLGIQSELGPFECQVIPDNPTYIKTEGGLRPVQTILFRGAVRGREHVVNLTLASGHVFENAQTQETVYNQVITNSFDKDSLLRQPGREITQEEYLARISKGGAAIARLKLSKVKRYLRLVITKKK